MKKRVLIFSILLLSLVWVMCKREGRAEPWSMDGECGPGLYWSMTEEGELTITGTGNMTDAPWREEFVAVSKLNLGEGITSIYERAFENYTKITEVTLPHTLVQIGKSAFSGCKNLKTVNMYENVERIDKYAFGGCEKLEELSMSSGIKKISESAFSHCYKLKEMNLPERLEEIGAYAFYKCISLKSLTIPKSVKKIGKKILENATGIRSMTNLSKVNIKLSQWGGDGEFYTNVYWYVNGKKVKILKSGQMAKARPKVYPIVYRLQGARVKGKKPKKYTYGVETKLPVKVIKKGYVFYGWEYNGEQTEEGWSVYSIKSWMGGKICLKPQFARFRIKNDGKHRIKVYVDLRSAGCDDSIQIRYSQTKNMENAKILNIRHKNEEEGQFGNEDAYGSVKTSVLEKGKRYWFQFRGTYLGWEGEDSEGNDGTEYNVWSAKKSIVIR